MRNTYLRPGRIACVVAATALLTVAGATSASAATPDPLGGLTGGLLGGSGGLPVVGGLLGGSGGSGDVLGGVLGGTGNLPLVGELTKGGIPVVGDLEGLPLIGGGALPLAPGTLPVGTVLNSVPIVGPLVGGVLGGVVDDLTGGGRAPNTGGTTNNHTPSGSSKAPRTSSVHADDDDQKSHKSKRDRDRDRDRDENEDTDDGVIPSGGVLAGSGEATGGPAALPFLLLGAAALGSAGVGVRRLITARGGA